MEKLIFILDQIRATFTEGPLLLALFGTHIYFTIRLRGIQRKIPKGIRLSIGKDKDGRSAFSTVATALAATIGTGNIIGISTAIAIGGPGAVFWCWLMGVLGIATCYAECYLSLKYRICISDGEYIGGPMYVMEYRLKQKNAAILFSVAAILVSFGMGCSVQARAISTAVTEQIAVPQELVGMILVCLTGMVILGGKHGISRVCTLLVPFMGLCYMGGCLTLLWMNRAYLVETLVWILSAALGWKQVVGGMIGGIWMHVLYKSRMESMRIGIVRGLFTNEAGLGSIPMAATSSQVKNEEWQALISMTGPFWDTVVMCAVTGITIVSGMVRNPELYMHYIENGQSDKLCFLAFAQLPFAGKEILSLSLVLFAFATILGWNYYGLCAVNYLGKGKRIYQVLYLLAGYFGCVMSLEMVWELSDFFNVIMVIPNLLCLWILRKEIRTARF